MYQGLCTHHPACSPLQGSQGSTCQDAAGTCITQRRALGMNHLCLANPAPLFCCAEAWEGGLQTKLESCDQVSGQQGARAHSPRPEPWGSSDQVCSSKPPPKVCSSCSCSGRSERICTIPAQIKAAFRRAPVEEQAQSHAFSFLGYQSDIPPKLATSQSGIGFIWWDKSPAAAQAPSSSHNRASNIGKCVISFSCACMSRQGAFQPFPFLLGLLNHTG